MAKKIKLFKPGTHVAMDGKAYEFSEADLKASAAAYNPELHAAPFCIGHPKHDAPAYGRLAGVEFTEGFYLGDPSKVDPAFAEAVNGGRFDRVSVSWYSPDSPANPVPGVWYPRHVGFLGATPPGCKGLGPVSFAEGEQGVVSFGDWNDRTIARMFRKMKNFFVEKFGAEEANRVLDEWDLEQITEEALRPEIPVEPVQPAFAEPPARKELGMTPEQIAAMQAENERLKNTLKTSATAAAHAVHVAFAEALVKDGKRPAAQKEKIVAVLDFAASIDANTISFGEGEAKEEKSAVEMIQDILSSGPKIIDFSEIAAGEGPPAGQGKPIPGDIAKYI